MSFKQYNPAVIAIAANTLGFEKSISINDDGTLNWYGETDRPTDQQILAEIPNAQKEYDTNGPLNI